MWILIVFNEETHEVHAYGPWDQEEQGNQAAHNYIMKFEGDTNSLLLTVTQVEFRE